MIKLWGCVLVVFAAGGFGLAKAFGFFSQLHTVREFSSALEILKCEMNYTLSPLAKLCRTVSKRTKGACSYFFLSYAQLLDQGLPRGIAVRRVLSNEKNIKLPGEAQMAILELFETLGAYELEGENKLLQLTAHRLNAAAEHLEKEKKPLAKSYAALGLCTGLALVILFL